MNGSFERLYAEEPTQTVEGSIHRCTQHIAQSEILAGAGRRMRNPLLSIFLGEGSVNHIGKIQETYASCWSDHARNLIMLKNAYSVSDIENAIVRSTQVEDRTINTTAVRIAWFWDIMDDNFDEYFACVKGKYTMPVATSQHRVFFIFCSQRNTVTQEKTRKRLKEQLIPWAEAEKVPLVLLSDATRVGPLNAEKLAENYRLAASMMLIMNSSFTLDEEDIGSEMAFEIKKGGLWSAAYHGCSKNFDDIVGVSLLTIIKHYRALGKDSASDYSFGASVQNRLCGNDRDYYNLLDDIFATKIQDKCLKNTAMWNDVPYTEAVAALVERLAQDESSGGIFGKLFGKKKSVATPEEAIASFEDVWQSCLELYYTGPVLKWLESPEGEKEIKNEMYARMTQVLSYDEMHNLLRQESQRIAEFHDNLAIKLPCPPIKSGMRPDALLHGYALRQVKLKIYKKLLEWLSEAMQTLSTNAAGFDTLLEKVQISLREDHMERSVVRAYGYHMNQLLEQDKTLLTKYIRPSKNEGELLLQLEQTFLDLVAIDKKQIYTRSLQGDLQFRIENGGAADAVNIISECFKYRMAEAGRLPTYNPLPGMLYCIMNDAMNDIVEDADAIGRRFIVSRSDRIERLFLFCVEEAQIMFSNEPV